MNHDAAAAPLTAREAEMAEIKAAEASTADDADGSSAQAGRSIIFGHAEAEGAEGEEGGENGEIKGALPWTDEVKARVRDLGENGEVGACAILVCPWLDLCAPPSHADLVGLAPRYRKSTSRKRPLSSPPSNPRPSPSPLRPPATSCTATRPASSSCIPARPRRRSRAGCCTLPPS